MNGYTENIEQATLTNNSFRKVVYTGKHAQLVLMSLRPGEEIGMEVHETTDQFFRFEAGQGVVSIDGNEHPVMDGSGVIIPAGARHNVANTSADMYLKFYTIYSPSHHLDGVEFTTRAEADASDEEFDGKTTE